MLTVHLEPEVTRLLGIIHMYVSGPVWPGLVVPAWYAVSVPQNAVSAIQFGLTNNAYAIDFTHTQVHGVCSGEPVWPSGQGGRLVSGRTSVQYRFSSPPFSSKVVVCGHCLVTLSLTINETLKWLSHPCCPS